MQNALRNLRNALVLKPKNEIRNQKNYSGNKKRRNPGPGQRVRAHLGFPETISLFLTFELQK